MLGPNDDHQLVARHRLADESRIVDLAFDEAEIRFAAANAAAAWLVSPIDSRIATPGWERRKATRWRGSQ
jgi:hypothetical protein